MGVLIFFAFVAAVAGAWWRFTEHAKSLGKGWYLRNVMAGTMATLIGLLALGFMASGGWESVVGAAIAFYAASAPWLRIEGNDVRWERTPWRAEEKNKTAPAPPVDPAREEVPILAPSPSERKIRQESLAAMKRAEQARKVDMERRGEKPAKPMWMESYTPSAFIDDETDPPPVVTGRNIDVILFDYLNQKGEFSSRRVKVTMVGAWEFEGIDLDKEAERTFRYERVVGDITSEKTGEVLDPEAWAASINPAVLSP